MSYQKGIIMTIQIKINDKRQTTFTDINGRFTKTYTNDDEMYKTFHYKSMSGMVNAARKISNKDTYVINYDKSGKGVRGILL